MWMAIIGGLMQVATFSLVWYLLCAPTQPVPQLSRRHPAVSFVVVVALLWSAALLIGLGLNQAEV